MDRAVRFAQSVRSDREIIHGSRHKLRQFSPREGRRNNTETNGACTSCSRGRRPRPGRGVADASRALTPAWATCTWPGMGLPTREHDHDPKEFEPDAATRAFQRKSLDLTRQSAGTECRLVIWAQAIRFSSFSIVVDYRSLPLR